jgi:hypothetical protein
MVELKDKSFQDLVKDGIELELDSIVQGEPLRKRVYQLMNLAVIWSCEQKEKKEINDILNLNKSKF